TTAPPSYRTPPAAATSPAGTTAPRSRALPDVTAARHGRGAARLRRRAQGPARVSQAATPPRPRERRCRSRRGAGRGSTHRDELADVGENACADQPSRLELVDGTERGLVRRAPGPTCRPR